jgi:hypothetical protein
MIFLKKYDNYQSLEKNTENVLKRKMVTIQIMVSLVNIQ